MYKFSNIMGNYNKTSFLQKVIAHKELSNFVLLEGDAGTGKTTIAKTIAMFLCCEDKNKETTLEPCGVCEGCKHALSVLDGGNSSYNLKYIDIAREKENFDSIVSSIFDFEISDGVYILDECHLLTHEQQSKLLIQIEKASDNHVIMCTSKSEMLLPELVDRGVRFEMEVLKPEEARALLDRVRKQGNYKISLAREEKILKASYNVPRAIIKNTKLVGIANPTDEELDNYLKIISKEVYIAVLESLFMDINYMRNIVDDYSAKYGERKFIEGLYDFIIDAIFRIEGNVMDVIKTNKQELTLIRDRIGYAKLTKMCTEIFRFRTVRIKSRHDVLHLLLTLRKIVNDSDRVSIINNRKRQGFIESTEKESANKEIKKAILEDKQSNQSVKFRKLTDSDF